MPTVIPASVAAASFQSTAPSAPVVGGFWVDTDTGTLHYWTGAAWVEVAYSPTAAGAIPASTGTTKGDLIAYTASGAVARVPVGANGTVLQANSAIASGVEFSSVGAIGDATGWVLLDQLNGGGGSSADVTFTAVAAYNEYRILGRRCRTGAGTSARDLIVQFNADTGTNYYNGATTGQTSIKIANLRDADGRSMFDCWIGNDPSGHTNVQSTSASTQLLPAWFGGTWVTAEQIDEIKLISTLNGISTAAEFHLYGRNIP